MIKSNISNYVSLNQSVVSPSFSLLDTPGTKTCLVRMAKIDENKSESEIKHINYLSVRNRLQLRKKH